MVLNSPPIGENAPGPENGSGSQWSSSRRVPTATPPAAGTEASKPVPVSPSGRMNRSVTKSMKLVPATVSIARPTSA